MCEGNIKAVKGMQSFVLLKLHLSLNSRKQAETIYKNRRFSKNEAVFIVPKLS